MACCRYRVLHSAGPPGGNPDTEIHRRTLATSCHPWFWDIFTRLCRQVDARAKLVPDAYLAALAIEHGCELISEGKDFRRFRGLRWRHPLN